MGHFRFRPAMRLFTHCLLNRWPHRVSTTSTGCVVTMEQLSFRLKSSISSSRLIFTRDPLSVSLDTPSFRGDICGRTVSFSICALSAATRSLSSLSRTRSLSSARVVKSVRASSTRIDFVNSAASAMQTLRCRKSFAVASLEAERPTRTFSVSTMASFRDARCLVTCSSARSTKLSSTLDRSISPSRRDFSASASRETVSSCFLIFALSALNFSSSPLLVAFILITLVRRLSKSPNVFESVSISLR
mmetsp:Transcript_195/g.501  ORF Transcript_195/g.501 Transcript_195/m.501 type:complete len:246 (-) Transcript_195:878-1615(-)